MNLVKLLFSLLLVISIAVGCGTDQGSTSGTESMEKKVSGAKDTETKDKDHTTESSGDEDEAHQDDESTDSNKDSTVNDATMEVETEGTYNGQADSHTVEIELEEGPRAFQITEELQDSFENLEIGTKLTFVYIKKNETKYITSVTVD